MTDLERLEQALFEAARGESPEPALRAIVLAAAPKATGFARYRTIAGVAVGAAALAAGSLLCLSRGAVPEVDLSVRAEPVKPAAKLGVPSARVEPRREPPAPEPTAQAVPRQPKTPPVRSLSEQVTLLKSARQALRAGDPGGALAILSRYASGANSVDMSAEATLLRVEALTGVGRQAEARHLAERFIRSNPDNPLVDRARALAGGSTSESGMGRENNDEQRDTVERNEKDSDTKN